MKAFRSATLWVVSGSLVAMVALADPVAAGVVLVGIVSVTALLRRRSRSTLRIVSVLAVIGVATTGTLAALVVPTFRSRPSPLIVPVGEAADATAGLVTPVGGYKGLGSQTSFEALGFVATDDDNAMQAVDQNVAQVSTLAATGLTLSADPGSLLASPVGDVLTRAHINGAQGLIVVSNYGDTDFDGARAEKVLNVEANRQRLISGLSGYVARGGWDGVVIDFELLPASVRSHFPRFISELKSTLGSSKRVMIAIPAFASPNDPDAAAFDVPALTAAADSITLMAYDDHETSVGPGDIAGLPWVRKVSREMLAQVGAASASKILLGVPSYGYLWPASGPPRELTVAQARAIAAQPGTSDVFDQAQGERHLTLADGSQAWYDDARSVQEHVALARQLGFAGIANWHLGGGDVLTAAQLGPVHKSSPQLMPGRPIQQVDKAGLVALTFDDGPDPTWTPRILEVLRRLHVPATFFVIGTNAQSHQELLRRELREGHVIGNHTYSHQDLAHISRLRAEAEIVGAAAVVEGITGRKPLLFRSPYGSGELSDAGSSDKDDLSEALGFHAVNWTVDTLDWKHPGPAAIINAVEQQKSARTVVLMHDGGGDRSQTLAALPTLIQTLRAEGYQFTTVDAFDGSISSPYAARTGVASRLRGIAIVALFRLDMASRKLFLALLLLLGVVAGWRLLVAIPLALYHGRSARRRSWPAESLRPTTTVLVPAHNEEKVLGRCLAAVAAQLGPTDRIIVVDDGSTDGTAAVACRYPVEVISQAKQGKAAALNAGLAKASTEVIVVLDADTIVESGFLDLMGRHFADPGVSAVAGNVKVGNRQSLLCRLQALEYVVSLNLDRRAQAVINSITVVPGAAGAFRHAALIAVGGYPARTLVEDADLTMSLLRDGGRIVYEPQATALTEAPEGVQDILKQRRRWSYGTLEVASAHRAALLRPGAGRVGWLTLPWLLVSQAIMPVLGPLVDLFLLYLILVGNGLQALELLALALSFDVVACGIALRLGGESLKALQLVPALRLIWRPLQLWAALASLLTWLGNDGMLWRRLKRHNSVQVQATPTPAAVGA